MERNRSAEDKIKKLEQRLKGHKSDAEGLRYEQSILNYFARQGWNNFEWRKKLFGYEFDLYGEISGIFSIKYLLVECKNKQKVSAADVVRFIMKVNSFYKRRPDVEAYFCYSEDIDRNALAASKGNNPPITFKKITR